MSPRTIQLEHDLRKYLAECNLVDLQTIAHRLGCELAARAMPGSRQCFDAATALERTRLGLAPRNNSH